MKIKDYKDLVAYKDHLKTKENLSQKVMNHSLNKNKNKMKAIAKKALIPIGVAVGGFIIGKLLDPNDRNLNSDEVKVKKVSSGTLHTLIDVAKVVVPLISAYVTKKQVEKVED